MMTWSASQNNLSKKTHKSHKMIVNYLQQPTNVKQVKEEQHGEQYQLTYINNQIKQIDKL
jgi:hypothetical protein